jgi:hypothetical protein
MGRNHPTPHQPSTQPVPWDATTNHWHPSPDSDSLAQPAGIGRADVMLDPDLDP